MSENKKSRKVGKKLDSCKNYRNNGRREFNKAVRLLKVLDNNPSDKNASEALEKLPASTRKLAEKKILETGYHFNS